MAGFDDGVDEFEKRDEFTRRLWVLAPMIAYETGLVTPGESD